jgi:hypothetical protein
MLINLMTVWKENVLPAILHEKELHECKEAQGPVFAQSSFQFDTPPQVVFVKDLYILEEATYYGNLPTVPLQPEEQKIYDQTLGQLRTNKNFYNGNQMLLTGAVYDTSSNILYLEAVRVDYVFLVTLEKMKAVKAEGSALHHKNFFKTGVLAPFISKDNKVSIISRKDRWTLRSVAAGFLECTDAAHLLTDLITETASKEADEEFVLDRAGHRRFDFAESPAIASISFRDAVGMGMTPTIEFVAPIRVKQDADFILSVMNNNEATHAHEHVPNSAVSVPVAIDEREIASHFMRQALPGNFLYGPVLHACAVQVHQEKLLAPRIAEISDSRFYPIGLFKPTPKKSLPDYSVAEYVNSLNNKHG